MIPKIIHQTWFNKNKLPTIFEKLRNESIKNNNDFEFMLWDDDNIDIDYGTDLVQLRLCLVLL